MEIAEHNRRLNQKVWVAFDELGLEQTLTYDLKQTHHFSKVFKNSVDCVN